MAQFLAMGGYGAYIWPAWGIAALVLGGLLFTSLRGLKTREQTLKTLETLRPSRRRAPRRADRTAGDPATSPTATEQESGDP